MTLAIAQVSPYAWPPQGDVAEGVDALSAALARRGHAVTVLAPSSDRAALGEGRRRLAQAAAGEHDALVAPAGTTMLVALGRPLPGADRRRLAGPVDLPPTADTAFARGGFDVVHLHEPLAPGPALAALARAEALRVISFHRPELLAGVAFLGPLVERALARLDLRLVASDLGRRTLEQVLPGDYRLMAPGVEASWLTVERASAEPPGMALLARGRDRVAARFALSVLREVDLGSIGSVTLIGPPDAPWRTRAAVPKALRDRVEVVPDAGAASRAAVFGAARIALVSGPEEAGGPAMREAMAFGCGILAPRCTEVEGLVRHGVEALLAPPFSAPAWTARIGELLADPQRLAALGGAARATVGARTWDDVAEQTEELYRAGRRARARANPRIRVDMRLRATADADFAAHAAAARERSLDAVVVAGPDGIASARALADAAGDGLLVVPGAEIAAAEGTVVGLFLERDLPGGRSLAETLDAIHEQGGLVMIPHPEDLPVPSAAALRQHADQIDLFEVACGAARGGGDLATRIGVLGCGGSGAAHPAEIGCVLTSVPPFGDARGLLRALEEAEVLDETARRASRAGRRPIRKG